MEQDLASRIEKIINNIAIEDGELTQYEKENVISQLQNFIMQEFMKKENESFHRQLSCNYQTRLPENNTGWPLFETKKGKK